MLLIMAFIIATLLTTVKRQSQELTKKSRRMEILLEYSSRLRWCVTIKDVADEVARRIIQLTNCSVICYLRSSNDTFMTEPPDFYPRKGATASELEIKKTAGACYGQLGNEQRKTRQT